jgi:RHS repeat-associated protein
LSCESGHIYTYNAEDVRIRNQHDGEDTSYAYNTNYRLSQLLVKTTNGVATKYVYGRGLVGEEVGSTFKTYHFDCRGSTVAITDAAGNITDTFAYDTYGNMVSRTGTSQVIFGYNGRAGVATDSNGLIYMRARYYAPEMRRFVNADIVPGEISNAVTLNRFAYANGNPVSFVDPFGLSPDEDRDLNPRKMNFTQAVLVFNRIPNEGLEVVGHTQMYFLSEDGHWFFTEYNTTGGETIPEKKSNAVVSWCWKTPPFYDAETKQYIQVEDIAYVKLSGNFNASIAMALTISEKTQFGDYNVAFNNCSDYTDTLLTFADVDGAYLQAYLGGSTMISVPELRIEEIRYWKAVDDSLQNTADHLLENGKKKSWINPISSMMLRETGRFIKDYSDAIGDISVPFVQTQKHVKKQVGKAVAYAAIGFVVGGKIAWDMVSSLFE